MPTWGLRQREYLIQSRPDNIAASPKTPRSYFTQSYFSHCWHRPLLRAGSRSWRVSPVTGQARAPASQVPAADYTPDIAPSIQSEFRTAVKLFSLIVPAPRSTPDRRLLVSRLLVFSGGLQCNPKPSWATAFLKQNDRR